MYQIKEIVKELNCLKKELLMDSAFRDEKFLKKFIDTLDKLEKLEKILNPQPEKSKFNEPWTPALHEDYWHVNEFGNYFFTECIDYLEDRRVQIGNCFKTEEEALQDAKETKLRRLLKAFSLANGGDKIDWNDYSQTKYYICYKGYIEIEKEDEKCCYGGIYFYSFDIAQEACDRYKKEIEEARNELRKRNL